MATNVAQQRTRLKEPLSRKRLQEIRQLKRQAMEFYDIATKSQLDNLTVELRLQQAKATIELALKYNPIDGDALNLSSRIHLELGSIQQARKDVEKALEVHPRNGGYWYSLGHVALSDQALDEAEAAFKKAIKYAAKETKADNFLAYTLQAKGKTVEAFQLYRELAKTKSQDPHIKSKLFETAQLLTTDTYDSELESDLIKYLGWDNVNTYKLSSLISSLLEAKFQVLKTSCAATSEEIASDELFLLALKKVLIKSGGLEKVIMAMRYELLLVSTGNGQIPKNYIPFSEAISIYFSNNEYMLPITDAEKNMTSALVDLCDSALEEENVKPSDLAGALLLLSMYAPWQRIKQFDKLLEFKKDWPDYLTSLYQKNHTLKELSLIKIESLSDSSDTTSLKVKNQYEHFPYPRWDDIEYKRTTHYSQALEQEYPSFVFPKYLNERTIRVMIAGCGTGRHSIHVAKYFRDVDVTAIDLSQKSLEYAKLKSREFGISNIQFYQADMLSLRQFSEPFHIIECSGVLHHIKHYDKALTKLLSNLVSGGLIKIALYSERARKPVIKLRKLFKRDGTNLDENRMKMIRQAIFDSQDLEGKDQLTTSDDFYSLSGSIDLLFHEYEIQFTPLKIAELCLRHSIKFLGFCSLPTSYKKAFVEKFGKNHDLTDLEQWEEFEKEHPTTFSAMYQFYGQKI